MLNAIMVLSSGIFIALLQLSVILLACAIVWREIMKKPVPGKFVQITVTYDKQRDNLSLIALDSLGQVWEHEYHPDNPAGKRDIWTKFDSPNAS